MGNEKLVQWFSRITSRASLFIAAFAGSSALAAGSPGVVYTQTNAISGNRVLIFERAADGSLTPAGTVGTGGTGNGPAVGLHSQGSVALGHDGRWLFVVNAGSNTLSSFKVTRGGLILTDEEPSGGDRPVSVAVHGRVLYVLNQGSDSIAGFRVGHGGELSSIPGSIRALSHGGAAAAQVAFDPAGETLVVTEKNTKTIDTFEVDEDGVAGEAVAHPSSGNVPYGFDFDHRGHIFVTEAGSAAVSSYLLSDDGGLATISASVPTTGNAPCWLVVTNDGKYAFDTNAASGTISTFAIAEDGAIGLLGTTPALGRGVTDEALSVNSQYLYALMGGSGDIDAFAVNGDGSLTAVLGATGLPAGTVGLAAR